MWRSRGSLSKGHRAHPNSKGELWRLGQIRPSVFVVRACEVLPDKISLLRPFMILVADQKLR